MAALKHEQDPGCNETLFSGGHTNISKLQHDSVSCSAHPVSCGAHSVHQSPDSCFCRANFSLEVHQTAV